MEEIMLGTFKRFGIGLAPSTVHRIRSVLKAAFRYAVDENLIDENPVSKTKLPSYASSIACAMTVEEANAFVSVRETVRQGDAFVFQLHTGLRPQELMALIWEDVNFEQGTIRIERACKWLQGRFIGFGPTKTKRGNRTIKIAPEYVGLLRAHYEKQRTIIEKHERKGTHYGEPKLSEWVIKYRPKQTYLYTAARLIFPDHHGRALTSSSPRKAFKIMLQNAGITTNYRWYDLRHTHATLLLTAGEPIHEVAPRMGHSVTMLLTMYAHFLPTRLDSAPTLLARLIPL